MWLGPALDLVRLLCILSARNLNPRLDLADRYRGQTQVPVVNALQPADHGGVGAGPAQLRNDVGIEEVHRVQIEGRRRRRPRPRSGRGSSTRAFAASNSDLSERCEA